jgi:hypothetical protein
VRAITGPGWPSQRRQAMLTAMWSRTVRPAIARKQSRRAGRAGQADRPRARFCLAVLLFAAAAGAAGPGRARAAADEPPWGDGRSRGEDLTIVLFTVGPGDPVAQRFGHTLILVQDDRLRDSRIYNYGMFSFDRQLLAKYVMGRLWFWAAEMPVKSTLARYKAMDRDIRGQTLALPPKARAQIAATLARDVRPENREYLYHHYDANCATRVRDIIDEALGGRLRAATGGVPARMTLRDHTRRLTHGNPALELLLVFLMNDEIDQPISVWHEMFLPMELEAAVAEFTYRDDAGNPVALVSRSATLHDADRPEPDERPALMWPWTLALGLAFAAAALALARARSRGRRWGQVGFGLHTCFIGALYGLPGLGLTLAALFTDHTVAYWNENLLLANPITTAALFLGIGQAFGLRWADRLMARGWYVLVFTSALAITAKLFPWYDQANSLMIALIVPVNVGFALAHARYRLPARSR